MTRENLNLAKDLLKQIDHLDAIKSKIHIHYSQSKDDALKTLLSECNDVCTSLKDIKQRKFEEI